MIDSTKIDELIVEARRRDEAVCLKLRDECARLVVPRYGTDSTTEDLVCTLVRARAAASGRPSHAVDGPPANGSFAYQLFSAICFVIDARAELKLLELIASPTFYDAIMRSAAEKKD